MTYVLWVSNIDDTIAFYSKNLAFALIRNNRKGGFALIQNQGIRILLLTAVANEIQTDLVFELTKQKNLQSLRTVNAISIYCIVSEIIKSLLFHIGCTTSKKDCRFIRFRDNSGYLIKIYPLSF